MTQHIGIRVSAFLVFAAALSTTALGQGGDTVVADTRSDAAGRYLLCGLPLGRIAGLFALKQGYSSVSYATVDAGSDAVVDIEITRR